MPERPATSLPFRVEFIPERGEVVVWQRFGEQPGRAEHHRVLSSLEEVAIRAAKHSHESWLQHALAQALIGAAVEHLGADGDRLRAAVRALRNPACTVPLGVMVHGAAAQQGASQAAGLPTASHPLGTTAPDAGSLDEEQM